MSRAVLFYPYANCHVVPRRAPDKLVEEWSKLVEVDVLRADESVDLEHWIESACMLRALVGVLGPDCVEIADEDTPTEGRVVFGPMPKYRALADRLIDFRLIDVLGQGNVIYIPTEAGLPILEAGRAVER